MQHACVFVSEWYRWNTGDTYSTTGSLQTEIIIRLWKGVESFQKGKHLVAGSLLATVLLWQEPTFSTITVAHDGKTSSSYRSYFDVFLWGSLDTGYIVLLNSSFPIPQICAIPGIGFWILPFPFREASLDITRGPQALRCPSNVFLYFFSWWNLFGRYWHYWRLNLEIFNMRQLIFFNYWY